MNDQNLIRRLVDALYELVTDSWNPGSEALAALEEGRRFLSDGEGTEPDPITPGATIEGFCGGMFGRESYGSKVIEAVGPDWIVAREDGHAVFWTGHQGEMDGLREEMT